MSFLNLHWDAVIRPALSEDFGLGGDITALSVVPETAILKAAFVTRKDGVLAGIEGAKRTFAILDDKVTFTTVKSDGDVIKARDTIAIVEGPARSVLGGERVALNIMGHLSGIATQTAAYVRLCAGTKAKIAATRKTLPNLRALQKYAVQCGGGMAHRYRLDDCILIKDNHVALCGGDVAEAVRRARSYAAHTVKIELEVDSLAQLEAALPLKPDIIMLDNFSLDDLKVAVKRVNDAISLEASGGVNLSTVEAIAQTGVDIISVGALTHSVQNLDIGLDAL